MNIEALRAEGGLLLHDALPTDLVDGVLKSCRGFFSSSRNEKERASIAQNTAHRGWSEMHNERDWREQLHFGRHEPFVPLGPDWYRLRGDNPWPWDDEGRALVQEYMEVVSRVGTKILGAIWSSLGVGPLLASSDDYWLLKAIAYHPQSAEGRPRPGVAAHVDFSWLTLTIQESAGLEIRSPDGAWSRVPADRYSVWVHCGELLECSTGGIYRATPHRVVNPSATHTRLSLPFFLNPPLDARVPQLMPVQAREGAPPSEHIHRVLPPGFPAGFVFGREEWKRKGLNRWCHQCVGANKRLV